MGSTGEPAACTSPTIPIVGDARLTVDAEGRLRDALGRDVVMRGINTGGRNKRDPFVPFPIAAGASVAEVRTAADAFFAPLRSWGLDTIRLPFSWEALEPTEGTYDQIYLDRYAAMVDAAWAADLRVIVDFHQDIYASPFCGDGFPPWTLVNPNPGPPRHDCPDWFFKYVTDPEVQEAFDRFWANTGGVQDAFVDMWTLVAIRFADHPGVVGFEIINEPGWGTTGDIAGWKLDVLTPFHERVAAELRAVAPDVLVLYDNPGLDALQLSPLVHPRPAGDGFVYAPHLYDSGLIAGSAWTGTEPEPPLSSMADFSATQGVPVLLGEFGYGAGAEGGPAWLDRLLVAVDDHRMSATLWEYSINEEPWNEEDLSVVDPMGNEAAVLDVYVRPWMRALAGRGPRFTWDDATGSGRAEWTSDGGITEIVIPQRRFPNGPQALVVNEGACAAFDAPTGRLLVTAPPETSVVVTFTN